MTRRERTARHDRDILARAFVTRAAEAIKEFVRIKDALAEKHRDEQQGRAGEDWMAEVGVLTARLYIQRGRVDALIEAFALACNYPEAHEAQATLGVRWGMLLGDADELPSVAQINRYIADVVTRDMVRPSSLLSTHRDTAQNGGDAL